MIICSCNTVSEKDVLEVVSYGATVEQALATLGVGADCGSCVDRARRAFAPGGVWSSLGLAGPSNEEVPSTLEPDRALDPRRNRGSGGSAGPGDDISTNKLLDKHRCSCNNDSGEGEE